MSCAKRLAPFWIGLLDLHIRISETNDLFFPVLTRLNNELLRSS
jgi:hypothetical protein